MPSSGATSIGRIVCVAPVSTSAPTAGRAFLVYLKMTGTSGSQLPASGTYSNRTRASQVRGLGNEVQADVVSLVALHLLQHCGEVGVDRDHLAALARDPLACV